MYTKTVQPNMQHHMLIKTDNHIQREKKEGLHRYHNSVIKIKATTIVVMILTLASIPCEQCGCKMVFPQLHVVHLLRVGPKAGLCVQQKWNRQKPDDTNLTGVIGRGGGL